MNLTLSDRFCETMDIQNVLSNSRINRKIARFNSELKEGPKKCPAYLKLPWIGNVSLKFEKRIKSAVTKCFQAVEPRVIFSTRKILPAIHKDVVPSFQQSMVVYQYVCRCDQRYVGRTTQRLQDRIKQHIPKTIHSNLKPSKILPERRCKETQGNSYPHRM